MAGLRGAPAEVIAYDASEYDFRVPVRTALGLVAGDPSLSRLHERIAAPLLRRETDQSTPAHQLFYANMAAAGFFAVYRRFVRQVIVPIVGESVYPQAVPNLRVQFPNNVAVGEAHRDRDFGQPTSSLNVWLPLTDAHDSCAVWLAPDSESDDPKALQPVDVSYGSFLLFDAANLLHGNVLNDTGATRVSIDFRVIPRSQYQPAAPVVVSVNTGVPIRVGPDAYYSDMSLWGDE